MLKYGRWPYHCRVHMPDWVATWVENILSQEHIRTDSLSKSKELVKFENLLPVPHAARTSAIVANHVTGCLFLAWFHNFDQTTGFYWSYMLLLKLPRSYALNISQFSSEEIALYSGHISLLPCGLSMRLQREVTTHTENAAICQNRAAMITTYHVEMKQMLNRNFVKCSSGHYTCSCGSDMHKFLPPPISC